jgi:hypothetical protein
VRLRSQELRPARPSSSWCGIDPGRLQDLPDGGGADPVAKAGQLAVDPAIPPGRVLSGQAHDQGAQPAGNGWPTGSGGRCGPAAGDKLSVPAQDRRRGDEQPEATVHGEQPSERGDQGSVGPAEPWWSVGTSEHGKLVAQHQDLDLLGSLGSGTQHRPAQELEHHQVDQPQRHRRIMPRSHPRRGSRSRAVCIVSGTHRVQIQPDHVADLGVEFRVGGELERLDPPGLQVPVAPDPRTVAKSTPSSAASSRLDQCVTRAVWVVGLYRSRQWITVGRDTPTRVAISVFEWPSPASSTIRARCASPRQPGPNTRGSYPGTQRRLVLAPDLQASGSRHRALSQPGT